MSGDPAEAMFFDGAPLAHVVAYRERQRLARIAERDRATIRTFLRRNPGWIRPLIMGAL